MTASSHGFDIKFRSGDKFVVAARLELPGFTEPERDVLWAAWCEVMPRMMRASSYGLEADPRTPRYIQEYARALVGSVRPVEDECGVRGIEVEQRPPLMYESKLQAGICPMCHEHLDADFSLVSSASWKRCTRHPPPCDPKWERCLGCKGHAGDCEEPETVTLRMMVDGQVVIP